MKRAPDLDALAESLVKVQALIDAVNADLAVMPGWKRGTRWHLDRVGHKQRLLAQRETLRARLQGAANCHPSV
jgi:hypothetical protein